MRVCMRVCMFHIYLKMYFASYALQKTRELLLSTPIRKLRFTKDTRAIIVYAHGRRLCSNRFRHGSTTISYPQCSLTFLCERYLHRYREQSFAIRAYAMSAVGIDVVSSHTKYCRIAYGITR